MAFLKETSKFGLTLASKLEHKKSELKYFEFQSGTFNLTAVATFYSPDGISVGAGVNQRVGRAIRVYGIHLQGAIVGNQAFNFYRVIVANRVNGYTAVPDVTIANVSYSALNSGMAPTRYVYDAFVGQPSPAATTAPSTSYPSIPINVTIPFKNGLEVRWDANHISSNHLYIALWSNIVAAPFPTWTGNCTIYYTDA